MTDFQKDTFWAEDLGKEDNDRLRSLINIQ